MGKSNNIRQKQIIWITASTILFIILVAIGVIALIKNNKYVGIYNYNDRNTIVLKQDGTCDFTDRGESGYSDGVLKCSYEVKDNMVYFKRDVNRYHYEEEHYSEDGEGFGVKNTCERFRGRKNIDLCKDEVVSIQETAIVGDTGMIYKDKTYQKLK